MLTKLTIRNFKMLDEAEIELGQNVVFVGPNNSGKTTALQALALWNVGLQKWNARRAGSGAQERTGVAINRRDLIAIPVPNANLLWRDLQVRHVQRVEGKPSTQNVRVEIIVEGLTQDLLWQCGLEFDYANDESFYVRPLRRDDEGKERMPVPDEASQVRAAFLPPMSGLAAVEPKWEPGRINVLIGEGQTAQVLRNLCYQLAIAGDQTAWRTVQVQMRALFGVELLPPENISERGEIIMQYRERSITLDLSSSGRGLQQTLLLLAYLYANPGSVLLLDEPDAHLEIFRQQQIYNLISRIAAEQNSQILAASHSEVVLSEAGDRHILIAFVGPPHRIDGRGKSQVRKALSEIGYEDYYRALQRGWVLYLEGSTDLAILQTLARRLHHPVASALETAFVHDVGNQFKKADNHFWGLREAKGDLVGIAILDRQEDYDPKSDEALLKFMWRKREIENYLAYEATLIDYARRHGLDVGLGPLFGAVESDRRESVMRKAIEAIVTAQKTLNKPSPFSDDIKASDDFLDPLFNNFYAQLGLPNLMRKANYHVLADYLPVELIDAEIVEKLDAIYQVMQRAAPVN